MRFDEPLWLVVLLPLVLAWRRARSPAISFPRVLAAHLGPNARVRGDRIASWLLPAVAAVLVVAMAQPQIGREVRPESASGVDIQLLLDVSGSMQLRDLGVNRTRLDVVRGVLDDFVALRSGDRLGLMTFALYPRSVCPLTRDHAAVRASLADVRPVLGNSPEDRTAIGVAIASATRRLAASTAKSKVLVMLTDGEQIVHDVSLEDAADYAVANGVRLYAVAAGRAQGPWTKKLEMIATSTGGRAFVARDGAALARVYAEIDALEKSDSEVERLVVHADVHAGFLLLALALLTAHVVLRGWFARSAP